MVPSRHLLSAHVWVPWLSVPCVSVSVTPHAGNTTPTPKYVSASANRPLGNSGFQFLTTETVLSCTEMSPPPTDSA